MSFQGKEELQEQKKKKNLFRILAPLFFVNVISITSYVYHLIYYVM